MTNSSVHKVMHAKMSQHSNVYTVTLSLTPATKCFIPSSPLEEMGSFGKFCEMDTNRWTILSKLCKYKYITHKPLKAL